MRRIGLAATAAVTLALASPVAEAGGTLDFGDKPAPRAADRVSGDWLGALIDRLLDEPETKKPRPMVRRPPAAGGAPARPTSVAVPGATVPSPVGPPRSQPSVPVATPPNVPPTPGASPPAQTPTTPPPAQPRNHTMTPTGPITTAGIPTLPRPATTNRDDLEAVLIGEAEKAQARLDLIKLELAGRTYAEPRLSGQPVYDTRPHWRVLERARDAFTESELAAAAATGFEANAYINERDKVIVVAIAGTQDLKRDFLTADIWDALIQSQSPQHFFMAKSYVRSVIQRYQAQGFHTECVGHSLGGGACAYAASELGIRAIVVNPISAGKLDASAYKFITNYIVDGDIAQRVYEWRGNPISGDIQRVSAGREELRSRLKERFGVLAGPILVVRELQNAVKVHSLDRALDLIAVQAGTERVR